MTFTSFDSVYYQGDGLTAFRDRVLLPRARLLLTDGDHRHQATLCLNRPVQGG
ncbi:MAG: hypothetical protein HKP58_13445 [Desulfatitalea sp.]|nr:hypothetical protein [Desulfatitalea sp.]NNK01405.1 hypothetical protein [Desulfatitalea sp.]